MEVRSLNGSDALPYQKLRLFGLRESPTAFGASFEEASQLPLEEQARRLSIPAGSGTVVGIFEENELVAVGGLKRFEGRKEIHKAWIWGMYVHPDFRRKGFGKAVMKRLLSAAAAMESLGLVRISVESTNVAARNLYASFGFESFGTEPKALCVDGRFFSEDHLFLDLSAVKNRPGSAR
ncbi:MAG: GNAT family N-acetyltransferase [Opitutaceae bacterium]